MPRQLYRLSRAKQHLYVVLRHIRSQRLSLRRRFLHGQNNFPKAISIEASRDRNDHAQRQVSSEQKNLYVHVRLPSRELEPSLERLDHHHRPSLLHVH